MERRKRPPPLWMRPRSPPAAEPGPPPDNGSDDGEESVEDEHRAFIALWNRMVLGVLAVALLWLTSLRTAGRSVDTGTCMVVRQAGGRRRPRGGPPVQAPLNHR